MWQLRFIWFRFNVRNWKRYWKQEKPNRSHNTVGQGLKIFTKRLFIIELLLCNRKHAEYLTFTISFNPQNNSDLGRPPEPKPGKGTCAFIDRKLKLRLGRWSSQCHIAVNKQLSWDSNYILSESSLSPPTS